MLEIYSPHQLLTNFCQYWEHFPLKFWKKKENLLVLIFSKSDNIIKVIISQIDDLIEFENREIVFEKMHSIVAIFYLKCSLLKRFSKVQNII